MPHYGFTGVSGANEMHNVLKLQHFVTLLLLLSGLLFTGPSRADSVDKVWLLTIDGAISPATADYFTRSLRQAEQEAVELLILQLDTPGGLDASMRDMIKAILASSVPVATYVSPSGSRAASAGTYILYASHIAAMAPATNVGSSTPVSMSPMDMAPKTDDDEDKENAKGQQSAMDKKMVNDAVAYIQGLAELRGRNAEWAEQTVREAVSLGASEALKQDVIDLVASDVEQLLQALDGQTVTLDDGSRTLQLADAAVTELEPGWRYELLSLITNPNVAYILLMIGIYGLILEFYNPGLGIAGVTGIICLLLAGYALHMLPLNSAGLALLIVGIGLMVAEAFNPSFGILGIGGLIAFVAGSILLFDSELPAYQVSLPLIAGVAITSFAVFVFVVGAALRVRQTQVVTGSESIIGAKAEATDDFEGNGRVYAQGEVWHAYCSQAVKKGQLLRIKAIDGLILHVELSEEQSS